MDETQDSRPNDWTLQDLLSSAPILNELQSRLAATLSQAIEIIHSTNEDPASSLSSLIHHSSPFDVILSSNLTQLARVEYQFKLLASDQLIGLLNQPTLDDPLLFSTLLPLIKKLSSEPGPLLAGDKLTSSDILGLQQTSEANFCLYMNQLETKTTSKILSQDPLKLVSLKKMANLSSIELQAKDKRKFLSYFHHLYHLGPLYEKLLADGNRLIAGGQRFKAEVAIEGEELEDEDGEYYKRVNENIRRLERNLAQSMDTSMDDSHRAHVSMHQLMLTMANYDVMFIYLPKTNEETYNNSNILVIDQLDKFNLMGNYRSVSI